MLNWGVHAVSFQKKSVLNRGPCWLKPCYPRTPCIMNAPLWVKQLHHHFLVGANSKTIKKWWRSCSTHKSTFMINDFIRNPYFRWWCKLQNLRFCFITGLYSKELWLLCALPTTAYLWERKCHILTQTYYQCLKSSSKFDYWIEKWIKLCFGVFFHESSWAQTISALPSQAEKSQLADSFAGFFQSFFK